MPNKNLLFSKHKNYSRIPTILVIGLLFFSNLSAQDVKIYKLDNTDYPLIKVIIGVKQEAYVSDFRISMDDKHIKFAFDTINSTGRNAEKNILFAIILKEGDDKSNFNEIYSELEQSIKKLPNETKINISISSIKDTINYSTIMSAEFSNDYDFFLEELNSLKDNFDLNYVYKNEKTSLLRQIEYFEKHADKSSLNSIVIITDTQLFKKGKNDFDLISSKHKLNNISAYYIDLDSNKTADDSLQVLLCENSSGIYTKIESNQISNTLQKYFTDISLAAKQNRYKSYRLSFEIPEEKANSFFYLNYKNQRIVLPSKMKRTIYGLPIEWTVFVIILIILNLLLFSLFVGSKLTLHNVTKQLKRIKEYKVHELPDSDNLLTKRGTDGKVPLIIVESGNFRKTYEFAKKRITIGRGEENNVVIPETTVSKLHAEIYFESGKYFIRDMESTNGIFFGDQKISTKELNSGDTLKLGISFLKIIF